MNGSLEPLRGAKALSNRGGDGAASGLWLAVASVASWLAIVSLAGPATRVAVLFGMLAPLAAASASWLAAHRTYRARPERLTQVMVTAFAVKLAFFGGYVAVMLGVLSLEPVPFIVSFTSYFIVLHAAEAAGLHRLFAGPRPAPAR